jgi:threonine aldolase
MRQVGVVAAAGIVALDSMVERLVEDHRRANTIGKGEEILSTAIAKIQNCNNNAFRRSSVFGEVPVIISKFKIVIYK